MDKPTQKSHNLVMLPKRNKGTLSLNFHKVVIESNRFKVDVSKLSSLSIFAMKFISDQQIQKPGEKEKMITEITPIIKKYISKPIIKDGLIFTLNPSTNTSDMTIQHKGYLIVIREVKRFNYQKNPEMLLYFLSNIMRKVMQKLNYIQIGNSRKFINMKKSVQIENVVIYSGFKVNFQLLQNGYFLTVDTTKKIVRNQNVLQYITSLYQTNQRLQRSQKRELVRKSLLNKIIMTNYGKTRYLRIQDVLFVDLTQIIVQNCKMSLPQYYKLRYDYQIKYAKQPLILANCKNSKYKTYLVPQLCLMTGIPEDFDQLKNRKLSDISKLTVEVRKEEIQNFIKDLHKQEELIFPILGIDINPNNEKVQAKLIPLPKIMLGEGKCVPTGRQSSFNLNDAQIFKAKGETRLGIIAFDGVESNTINDYFQHTLKNLKMKITIRIIKADNQRLARGMESIQSLVQMAKQKQNCNLCVIVIPNKMKHLYPRIKQLTLLKKQLGCQVVLQKTLKNKNIQSVALKIILQALAKSGNIIWATVPQTKKQKIMIIAYYSCQLSKSKSDSYTISICATCDDLQTQIYSNTKKYIKQHEQLQSMKQLFFQAITAYKKRNGDLPDDIIIIQNKKPPRTGQSTINFFVEPAITTMQEYYGLKRPKITYVLITKCLNHRFYRKLQGKYTNPPLGTLINGQVTAANKLNFYMVAHNVCKKGGSIIPLNFQVIFSDSNIQEGVLQTILFSQCFNYVNYTGAIKQPGVLQYAIKCAKFGAEVLCNVEVPDKFKMYPYYI